MKYVFVKTAREYFLSFVERREPPVWKRNTHFDYGKKMEQQYILTTIMEQQQKHTYNVAN